MAKFIMEFERPLADLEKRLDAMRQSSSASDPEIAREIIILQAQIDKLKKRIYRNLTPWQKVQLARHPDRPKTLDYINMLISDFLELSGDRRYADDPAIIAGFGRLDKNKVVIIGHNKGGNTKENVARNFGMPHPEGFWKSLRIMKIAEKFKIPLLCFIDTQGAYPGIGAEERGQGVTIAQNLMEMCGLKTPVIAINIAEGGSGGALALGICDKLLMLENAYYSVISPEGCASILWHDESKANQAAEILRLTAKDLKEFGIVDEIIDEPLGGAHQDPEFMAVRLKKIIKKTLSEIKTKELDELIEIRQKKIRQYGKFNEELGLEEEKQA